MQLSRARIFTHLIPPWQPRTSTTHADDVIAAPLCVSLRHVEHDSHRATMTVVARGEKEEVYVVFLYFA